MIFLPPHQGDPVIIIPAYNEEANIAHTIDLIRQTDLSVRIIVVDDGSSDKTADTARKKGVIVFRFSTNRGKASAFLQGLKQSMRLSPPPSAIVSLDADMRHVPRRDLQKMIRLANAATRGKQTLVVRAGVGEYTAEGFIEHMQDYSWRTFTQYSPMSGIRSFSIYAVHQLLSSRAKKYLRGYGLEHYLNHFFQDNTKIIRAGFVAHEPFRGEERKDRQRRDFSRARELQRKIARSRPLPPRMRPIARR